MKEVKLQFPDISSLWNFEESITGLPLKVETKTALLVRLCELEEIMLAIQEYNAVLLT